MVLGIGVAVGIVLCLYVVTFFVTLFNLESPLPYEKWGGSAQIGSI